MPGICRRISLSSNGENQRYRYDSAPGSAVFLQRDPLGYVDGMGLYVYVGNNPVNFFDPWGLAAKESWWTKDLAVGFGATAWSSVKGTGQLLYDVGGTVG